MKNIKKHIIFYIFITLVFSSVVNAQYREYFIKGTIVDINKQPIKSVVIIITNKNDNSRFSFKTNKKGVYKIAGISHGIYKVLIRKEGFREQEIEWNMAAPQQRMKKVKIDTITLITEKKFEELTLNKELKKKYEEAKKLIDGKKYAAAILLLEKLMKNKPDEVNINYLYGVCLEKTGKIDEAQGIFNKVVRQNPEFTPVNFKLAVIYQNKKNYDKAIEFYKNIIKLDTKNWLALYNIAIMMFQKDKIDETILYINKVLEMKPEDGPSLECLGLCYLKKGDIKKAKKYLTKAKEFLKNSDNKVKNIDEILKKLADK